MRRSPEVTLRRRITVISDTASGPCASSTDGSEWDASMLPDDFDDAARAIRLHVVALVVQLGPVRVMGQLGIVVSAIADARSVWGSNREVTAGS